MGLDDLHDGFEATYLRSDGREVALGAVRYRANYVVEVDAVLGRELRRASPRVAMLGDAPPILGPPGSRGELRVSRDGVLLDRIPVILVRAEHRPGRWTVDFESAGAFEVTSEPAGRRVT